MTLRTIRRRDFGTMQGQGVGMRVVVAGGTGFIGSKLWESLLARGHDVVASHARRVPLARPRPPEGPRRVMGKGRRLGVVGRRRGRDRESRRRDDRAALDGGREGEDPDEPARRDCEALRGDREGDSEAVRPRERLGGRHLRAPRGRDPRRRSPPPAATSSRRRASSGRRPRRRPSRSARGWR